MKITVPIICGQITNKSRQKLLYQLEAFGADEVFVSFFKGMNNLSFDPETLKVETEFLRRKGYKVAVWLLTLSQPNFYEGSNNALKISINGEPTGCACPLHESYLNDYCQLIKTVAGTGVKKIVLDDDLRMQSVYSETCCFCDKHMKFYSDFLGYPVTLEEMREGLLSGEVNQYRTAWTAGCKEALKKFCTAVRHAADEVDEEIEIMLCSGPALFGADGTDAFELVDLLAGKRKQKEFRLIGAPYWGTAHKLVSNNASAYDFARHQAFVAKQRGYITVGEGDPHPRPRYECPAYEVEFFHTVMLADGNVDRIMKYGLDYFADFDYEKGYAEFSVYNKDLYEQIERMFSGKECVGFHLVEPFDRILYARELSITPELTVIDSAARKFLNDLSLPAVFNEGGVNVILGENARNLEKSILKYGNILDVKAAILLKEQGVDVGLKSFMKIETPEGFINEKYFNQNDWTNMMQKPKYLFDLELCEGAIVQSTVSVGNFEVPASFLYENSDGERFLIFGYDLWEMENSWGYVRNYYRQQQVVKATEWLNRKKPAAVCLGNPDLYLMTKTDGKSLAIGLWNHFSDAILKPEILLGESYKSARFVNCEGELKEDIIYLNKPLGAYSHCFIEVIK